MSNFCGFEGPEKFSILVIFVVSVGRSCSIGSPSDWHEDGSVDGSENAKLPKGCPL